MYSGRHNRSKEGIERSSLIVFLNMVRAGHTNCGQTLTDTPSIIDGFSCMESGGQSITSAFSLTIRIARAGMDEMLVGLTTVAFHHISITIFWVSFSTVTLATRVGSFAFAF